MKKKKKTIINIQYILAFHKLNLKLSLRSGFPAIVIVINKHNNMDITVECYIFFILFKTFLLFLLVVS